MPDARAMEWQDHITENNTIASNTQVSKDLSANINEVVRKGCTVARILLQMNIRPNTINAFWNVHWGIAMVTKDAAVASALPDPSDQVDGGGGWLGRGLMAGVTEDLSNPMGVQYLDKDLRSSRIFRGDEMQLRLILDQDASGITVTYNIMARVLCWKA